MASWAAETVRNVIRAPLLVVWPDATEVGRQAVEVVLSAINATDPKTREHLIRPLLGWQQNDLN